MNKNKIKLIFPAISKNEAFARSVISCFVLPLNPSLSDLSDIKTAVSEAVTNAIVHAYKSGEGDIVMESEIIDRSVHIKIIDSGIGIENLSEALEPFFTTKPDDERSGMGFTIMKSFMDKVSVISEKGKGTTVYMIKNISSD